MKHQRSDNDGPALTAREIANRKVLPPASSLELLEARGKPSEFVHVRNYQPSNWFTARGVVGKRREIEAKGLPSFYHWRFITLTIDQSRFASPLEAFLHCRNDLRKFAYRCRARGLWKVKTPWCWKLEFHPHSGWPHWHLLVGRTSKFSQQQLDIMREEWSHGRSSVEMVRNDDFLYSFKYAFKPVLDVDETGRTTDSLCAPEWFLDYSGTEVVKVKLDDGTVYEAKKTKTFQRVRFWQTSKNFYTGKPRVAVVSDKPQQSWLVPFTVRQKVETDADRVQFISRSRTGKYQTSAIVALSISFAQFWNLAGWHAAGNNGAFLGYFSAVVPSHLIQNNTKNKWEIQQHLKTNRLNLVQAQRLQRAGETLRKC